MRTISLTNRLEFEFKGSVLRKGLVLGDVDNDGCNELIIGNITGDVVIFKGRECFQTITNLGFVSCLAVGDILNIGRNCLVILTGDGWCYIYCIDINEPVDPTLANIGIIEEVDGQVLSGESTCSKDSCIDFDKTHLEVGNVLKKIHVQRIPANTKDVLVGDIDGDGLIEMVLGLTDRVVRSYRWYFNEPIHKEALVQTLNADNIPPGKLVCLNKWECAKQIGSISLHNSCEGAPTILVAQPGGTLMRIRCHADSCSENISDNDSNHSENSDSLVDYQFLGLTRMRNQNVSTEVLGKISKRCNKLIENLQDSSEIGEDCTKLCEENLKKLELVNEDSSKDSHKNEEKAVICNGTPYAVATLDGTIMLVQDDQILWSIAVDHQIFALSKLDVTQNGLDDLVVCTWDGHTYLFDQEKHTVRFQLDESVQGFECGYYSINPDEKPVPCFVYLTFRNKILLYYNIPLKYMTCRQFELDPKILSDLLGDDLDKIDLNNTKTKREIMEFLLYGVEVD